MQIRFEFDTKYGIFKDALNLPDEHGFSNAELDAIKQARVDAWILHIDTASATEE